MSKPIVLTKELKMKMLQEFAAKLNSAKLSDKKFTYTCELAEDTKAKATVCISLKAYHKMFALVTNFSSEVAWHGVCKRDENSDNVFHITDILVYPQIVTGSTVNTDQKAYEEWLFGLDDEVFNNLRFQGHSHVNFSTTPSSVDKDNQDKLLTQLRGDMFYVFMIVNKRCEVHTEIYDLKTNTAYDTRDIETVIEGFENTADFIAEAEVMVKTKPAVTTPAKNTATSKPEAVSANSYKPANASKKSHSYDDIDAWYEKYYNDYYGGMYDGFE